MRKPSRVDAFDAGFYSHALTIYPTPRMKDALDNCLSSIGLGKYDPLLFERLEKMVTRDNVELQTWFEIGAWLHFDLKHFEQNANSRWVGHSLTEKFERADIDPAIARALLAKLDAFCKNKTYIRKKQDREVVKYFGIQMDLNTSPAVTIVEDLRDIARERDEKEAEAMANDQRERLNRPVQHVHIHDSVFGTVNLGTVEGNINSSIAVLKRDTATQDIAQTLQSLIDAIHHNSELASEQKMEALETIETLGEQARLPGPERKPSSYKAALGYLPTLLKSAESASRLWEAYGPGLQEFFKTHL